MTSAPKLFWSLTVCAVLFLSACLGMEEDYQIENESYGAVVEPGDVEPSPEPIEPVPIEPVCPEPPEDGDDLCVANVYCCNPRNLIVSKKSPSECKAPSTAHTTAADCLTNSVCGDSCRID